MKKILFLLLCTFNSAFAQQLFQKTYGNLLDDWFYSIEVVNDTDIYVVGYTRENDPMNNTILISALNSSGTVKWSKSINVGYGDFAYKIKQLSDGNLLLTGDVADYLPPGDIDMLNIKMDLSGNVLWKKNWGSINNETIEKSLETTDNEIISVGNITYYGSRVRGGLKIVKTDLSGNIIWDKTILFDDSAFPIDIIQTSQNKYLISGSTSPFILSNADENLLLVEMDSLGNINWAKGYGGWDQEYPANIVLASDGGSIIGTTSFSYDSTGHSDIIAIHTDSSGNVLWSKKYGGIKNEILKGILRDTMGSYLFWGSSTSFQSSFLGIGFIFKIDQNGEVLWSRIYRTSTIFDVKQIHEQLLISGQILSPHPPANSDGFLIRADWIGNSGCLDTLVLLPSENIDSYPYNVMFRDTLESYTINTLYSDTSILIGANTLCDSTVSIDQMNIEKEAIHLNPNPNNGNFHLKLCPGFIFNSLKIFNLLGQEITFQITFIHSDLIIVNLINNNDGFYLVRLTDENYNSYVVKTLVK